MALQYRFYLQMNCNWRTLQRTLHVNLLGNLQTSFHFILVRRNILPSILSPLGNANKSCQIQGYINIFVVEIVCDYLILVWRVQTVTFSLIVVSYMNNGISSSEVAGVRIKCKFLSFIWYLLLWKYMTSWFSCLKCCVLFLVITMKPKTQSTKLVLNYLIDQWSTLNDSVLVVSVLYLRAILNFVVYLQQTSSWF